MKNFGGLLAVFIRSAYRNKLALFVMLGFALVVTAFLLALGCALALAPALGKPELDRNEIERWLALIVYGAGLIGMGMNFIIFSANPLMREKESRIYDSILAAPVGVRGLWAAKALAVFLPGLLLCEAFALLVFLGVNCFLVAPRAGFIASPLLILNGFALVPLVYLPLAFLVLLAGLTGRPGASNVIGQVFFSAHTPLVINLAVHTVLDPSSPDFTLVHLAVAALLALLVAAFLPKLTKERVVLSARK